LALIGGGDFDATDAVDRQLLARSGGDSVLVLPTADAFEHPERSVTRAESWFAARGGTARGLAVLARPDAFAPEHVADAMPASARPLAHVALAVPPSRVNSRVAPARAGRAAENIAYGYDGFEKTLGQWIDSSGHRKNLLLPKASRVGVASAKSATSHRTYWAMVIAGDYEPPPTAAGKKTAPAAKRKPAAQSCRLKLLSLCL
jgi:hypothetical protein